MSRGVAARPRGVAVVAMGRLVVTVVAAVLAAAPVLAHPDGPVVETTLHLAPGDEVAFPVAVHDHRLVAVVAVASGSRRGGGG